MIPNTICDNTMEHAKIVRGHHFCPGCHIRNYEHIQKQERTNEILITDYAVHNVCFLLCI